ncbi:MAG: tripartite tricarboxylate transporter substrate binding protein [Acetobacteraceae bacterium]|nr:tripartite tricarboxylate transporter substrate binding protein [Acetobacteraceae bacterium]
MTGSTPTTPRPCRSDAALPTPHAGEGRGGGGARRRTLLAATLALAALRPARAQTFPDRPIRILVGFPPGGSVDITVRSIAPRFGEALGQPVIVENRPGAGATIATEAAVRSPPDGYTLVYGSIGTLVVNPLILRELSYDVRRDLLPIGMLVDIANALVIPPDRPWQGVNDMIAAARAAPGRLNWGHSGVGTSGHLTAHLLDQAARIETVGVAYRGGAALATDLMAGRIDYAFSTVASVLPNIRDGKLRVLAVPTAERQPWLPDAPTLAESGLPGFAATNWSGLLAPRGTPEPVIARLAAALAETMRDAPMREVLIRNALTPLPAGPEEFRALRERERARWEPVVRASGASAN